MNIPNELRPLITDLRDLAYDAAEHHRHAMGDYRKERQARMDLTIAKVDALLAQPAAPADGEAVEVVANVSTMGFGKHFAMGIGESINKLTPGDELMAVAQHQRIVAAISAQQSEPERVIVPVEPPRELLMSMALRLDHGLGCTGYYDQPIFGSGVGVTHAQRLESALSDMRKVYEEVTGQGFYSPANAERYSALLASAGQEVES